MSFRIFEWNEYIKACGLKLAKETMKKQSWALLICCLLMTVSGLNTDLYAPSLPYIAKYFSVHQSSIQLSMTAVLLGMGLGQIPFGVASDCYGRRKPLLFGVALFIFASLLILLWQNVTILILGRFLQGLAMAASSAITKSIVKDLFEGIKLKRNLSLMATAWGVGPIVGPAIGGYLQYYFSWQAAFVFFVVLGLTLFFLVISKLSETNRQPIEPNFQKMRQNLKILLSCRSYMASIGIMGLSYGLLMIFNVMGPFLIQETLHYSVVDFGHIALLVGLVFILSTYLNRILLTHFKLSKIIKLTSLYLMLMAVIMLLLSFLLPLSLQPLVVTSILVMSAVGIMYPSNMVYAMSIFPKISGTAAAMMGTVNLIITASISAIASFLPTRTMHAYSLLYLVTAVLIIILSYIAFADNTLE